MSSVRWVSYNAAEGADWMQRIITRQTGVTVGRRNSGVALCASTMDAIADPAAVAPRGASKMAYPELTYPGPIEEFAG